MKRIRFLILMLWCMGGILCAQNKQILYDFTEVPQALLLNPGMETDYQWYAGVPLLSGLSVQAGSSGISVNDLFADDGVDFNTKIRDKVINGMSFRDELSAVVQIDLLNGGIRAEDPSVFYSFGVYNEVNVITYWPKDYGLLAFEGNVDRLNERFDLSHLKARGEMLNVFHFGVNKKMNKNLILGVRGKIYSSILDFDTSSNKGYFVNTKGQNNILASTLSADMQLRTSGIDALEAADTSANIASTILKRGLFGGNLGLGADLGFTYYFNDQSVLTASILDLGFIYHSNSTENFTLKGDATIEGLEVILPDALLDPDQEFWEDLVDEVEAFVPFEENAKKYVTFRPTKLYSSYRYNFGEPVDGGDNCNCDYQQAGGGREVVKYRNSIGAQLYVINRPRGPQSAVSAFYQRRFGNFMAVKAVYTADKYTKTNLGFGVNFQAGPVNVYIMGDNLLSYQNIAASNYASFQFGLNIISWAKK